MSSWVETVGAGKTVYHKITGRGALCRGWAHGTVVGRSVCLRALVWLGSTAPSMAGVKLTFRTRTSADDRGAIGRERWNYCRGGADADAKMTDH